jgi:hypothetical protein
LKHLDWVKDISRDREVQERIESDCQSLIDAYFHENDDYAIEKFLKTYTEGFRYLERNLLYQRKIHPDNAFDEPMVSPAEVQKRLEEVRNIMLNEAKRQFRHALTFMSSIKSHSRELVAERRNFALLENAIETVLDEDTSRKVFAHYHEQRNNS